VPATYSTDPYTGKEVLVEPAHHVNNGTIELWITNQQYAYSNGLIFHVFYLVQTKGHYEEKWVFATPTFDSHLLSSTLTSTVSLSKIRLINQIPSTRSYLFQRFTPRIIHIIQTGLINTVLKSIFRCKPLLVMNPNILFLTPGCNFSHPILDVMKQASFLI